MTIISIANTVPREDAMVIMLKNTFVTENTMMTSRWAWLVTKSTRGP